VVVSLVASPTIGVYSFFLNVYSSLFAFSFVTHTQTHNTARHRHPHHTRACLRSAMCNLDPTATSRPTSTLSLAQHKLAYSPTPTCRSSSSARSIK